MMMERIGPCGLEVTGIRRDGRRRYDPASKERLIDACLRPGVSVSRMALDHGVNTNLVRKWLAYRRQSHGAGEVQVLDTSPFVRIETGGASVMSLPAVSGHAVAAACPEAGESTALQVRVEASLPNGARVSLGGCDAQLLAVMIDALGRCDVPSVG